MDTLPNPDRKPDMNGDRTDSDKSQDRNPGMIAIVDLMALVAGVGLVLHCASSPAGSGSSLLESRNRGRLGSRLESSHPSLTSLSSCCSSFGTSDSGQCSAPWSGS